MSPWVLQGQRDAWASVAIVPAGYVQAGDSGALKAMAAHAQAMVPDTTRGRRAAHNPER